MNPKRIFLSVLLIASGVFCKAQTITHIGLNVNERHVSIGAVDMLINNIILTVDPRGNIILNAATDTNFDYYGQFDDSDKNGKLKSIGGVKIDYYDKFDMDEKLGKLKSVGDVKVDYYDKYDSDNQGRIKSIGKINFAYYDKYDQDNQGKVKSIGDTKVTWYDRYDGDNNGKLKSVGGASITYYDKYDGPERAGKVKAITGYNPLLTINGM